MPLKLCKIAEITLSNLKKHKTKRYYNNIFLFELIFSFYLCKFYVKNV